MPKHVYHPCPNDAGEPVVVKTPSASTGAKTWRKANAVAMASLTDTPDLPKSLHGVAFTAHPGVTDWATLNESVTVDEPPYRTDLGLRLTSGCVVIEPDGRVWLVHPTNRYANVRVTFPKGRHEAGLTLLVNAVKETWEESGLWVEPVAYLTDIIRTRTVTRYYVARRVAGSPVNAGWESQAVSLVPVGKLMETLNRPNDQKVVPFLTEWLKAHPETITRADKA